MDYDEHEAYARTRLPSDDDYILVAESFSGPIGIAIAASRPAGLRGLILCVSFASNPLPMFSRLSRLVGALPALAFTPPGARCVRRARTDYGVRTAAMAKVSARVLAARVAAILAVDRRAQLARINVPLLYLRARRTGW
jgi:pimeloyl-ACP methyl ester carboxylesterase